MIFKRICSKTSESYLFKIILGTRQISLYKIHSTYEFQWYTVLLKNSIFLLREKGLLTHLFRARVLNITSFSSLSSFWITPEILLLNAFRVLDYARNSYILGGTFDTEINSFW